MPTAAEWKATGNEHLKKQEYDKAIEAYTEAIKLEPNHVFFSNRSAAYANKGSYAEALADGEACIKAKPDWPKGYSRKGAALEYLGRYQEAMQAYMAGLQHDQDNASLKAALQNVVKVVQQQQQWAQQQQAQAQAQARARAAQAAAAGGQSQEGKEQAEALLAAFGDDMIPNLESNPMFRKWFEEDEEFHRKILEVQKNPMPVLSQLMSTGGVAGDDKVSQVVSFLVQKSLKKAQDIKMSKLSDEDRKEAEKELIEKRMKQEEEARKREALEHERARKAREAAKKRKKEAEAKAKLDRMPKEQRAAHALKDEGNKLYKAKDFTAAIAKYEEAHETYPKDCTFLSNIAAVQLSGTKDYDACIATCEKGLAIAANGNGQDFKVMARLYGRMGNAWRRKGDENLGKAIECFDKALRETHLDDIFNTRKACVKRKKRLEAQAYFNPEEALKAKARGNEHFKAHEFRKAIEEYSDAIKRDPKVSAFYSNRAAAYQKVMEYARAKEDCQKAIELEKNNVKAWGRLGDVQFFQKEYHRALESYENGMRAAERTDANGDHCRDGMVRTRMKIQTEMYSGEVDPERAARGMADPEIQRILQDPTVSQVLRDMQQNPMAAQTAMKNPGVAAKIEKLIAAGVVGGGPMRK